MSKPFNVVVDVSDYCVGGCLSQTSEEGHQKPVAFASCNLTQTQQNWAIIELAYRFFIGTNMGFFNHKSSYILIKILSHVKQRQLSWAPNSWVGHYRSLIYYLSFVLLIWMRPQIAHQKRFSTRMKGTSQTGHAYRLITWTLWIAGMMLQLLLSSFVVVVWFFRVIMIRRAHQSAKHCGISSPSHVLSKCKSSQTSSIIWLDGVTFVE